MVEKRKRHKRAKPTPKMPSSSSSEDQPEPVDVILYETTYLRPDDTAGDVAKPAMESALQQARLDVVSDRYVFGNHKGRSILEQLQDMKKELGEIRTEIRDLREGARVCGEQIRVHGEQLRVLSRSSKGYRKVRMRFLATWNRDILRNATDKDLKYIQEGNIAAHGGDALTDADLYAGFHRHDLGLFLDIYGLSYQEVIELGDRGDTESIGVLNRRAEMKMKHQLLDKPMPTSVEDAWRHYIQTLKDHWPQKPADNISPLTHAPNTFNLAIMTLKKEE